MPLAVERIPTAVSPAEIALLQKLARGKRVVECGALLGYSTLKLAEVARVVISVDKHEGYGPSTLRAFMSNIEGKLDTIVPVVADARKVLPSLDCDVYFIDLDGTYATTYEVLRAIPYRGLPVAVHDFRRAHCDGVERAIRDAKYRVATVADTLAVVER